LLPESVGRPDGPQGLRGGGRRQPDAGGRRQRALQRRPDPAHPGAHDARVQTAGRGGEPGDRPAGEVRGEIPAGVRQMKDGPAREGEDREEAPPRSPRQTLSYLRGLFEERGIKPKNKLGQNFLIDLNLIDLLLRTAELTRDDLALEVGSGTGSLTARLA